MICMDLISWVEEQWCWARQLPVMSWFPTGSFWQLTVALGLAREPPPSPRPGHLGQVFAVCGWLPLCPGLSPGAQGHPPSPSLCTCIPPERPWERDSVGSSPTYYSSSRKAKAANTADSHAGNSPCCDGILGLWRFQMKSSHCSTPSAWKGVLSPNLCGRAVYGVCLILDPKDFFWVLSFLKSFKPRNSDLGRPS